MFSLSFLVKPLKILFSLTLAFVNIFPFGNIKSGKIEAIDESSVKLTISTLSDTHIQDTFLHSGLLELGLYDISQSKTNQDLLLLVGDITNHGYLEEYERVLASINKYELADNILFAEGNHDTWTEPRGYTLAREYFTKYASELTGLEIENPYYSTTIKGYPFIIMGSEADHTAAYISDAQLEWLAEEMKKASETGLPIFVVSHWPLNQTHGLPETWGDDEPEPDDGGLGDQSEQVERILKSYKNVFFINGHLHLGFSNGGKLKKYVSVEHDGSFHSINCPSYTFLYPELMGCGYTIEVYDDRVELRARNYTTGLWYSNYDVTIPIV